MVRKNIYSDEEREQWIELYEYVKKNILGYTDDMKLPKKFVLRLNGLKKGVFISNKYIQPQAEYSYKAILLTFKAKSLDIMLALRNNSATFKDENHKFNYIMAVVESEINNIVIRMNNVKRAEEKVEDIEINIPNNKATYIKKTKDVKSKILKDLW